MKYRFASIKDCPLLAEMNQHLLHDEGHRNRMTFPELEQRMRAWLTDEYRGVIFEVDGLAAAYALYREEPCEIYLRQFFVVRGQRRCGIGRQAMQILRERIWPKTKRLTVEVLAANQSAVAFWRAMGYADYSLMLEILPDWGTS